MKFGLFTCPYQFGTLEQAFKDAADFEYDYIELWGGRPHAYSFDLVKDHSEVLDLIDKYQIPVKVYTPEHNAYPFNYMLGDDRQWEDCMEYFDISLKASKLIDAEAMMISVGNGGAADYKYRWDRLIKSLRYISSLAEKHDQKVYVETLTQYESNTCTRLAELQEALDTIDSPYVLPMVDLVAPFTQGENPADYVKAFKDKLTHIHLVDSDGESDTHLIPGDGVMGIRKIINEMKKYGFNGTATIELVTHYISDPTYYGGLAINRAKEILL